MKTTKPLTHAEATMFCNQHQALIGRTLVCEPTDFFLIEQLAVTPYDEEDKGNFASKYIKDFDYPAAIAGYKGIEYDVVIFARNVSDKNVLLYETLNNYLEHDRVDLTDEQIPSYVM